MGSKLRLGKAPTPATATFRVYPGGLSVGADEQVSRTIGDLYAKDPRYGGNSKATISLPETRSIAYETKDEFVILGSSF